MTVKFFTDTDAMSNRGCCQHQCSFHFAGSQVQQLQIKNMYTPWCAEDFTTLKTASKYGGAHADSASLSADCASLSS